MLPLTVQSFDLDYYKGKVCARVYALQIGALVRFNVEITVISTVSLVF